MRLNGINKTAPEPPTPQRGSRHAAPPKPQPAAPTHAAAATETVAREMEQFMKNPQFHAALEEDIEIFGQEGVAQIRAAIAEALSTGIKNTTKGDLLRKITGAIHSLGQGEIRTAANENRQLRIKKSAARKAVLAYLTGMATYPRLADQGAPVEKKKTFPIAGDLPPELRKIKSEAKRMMSEIKKVKNEDKRREMIKKIIKILTETYEQNHLAQRHIGFIGYIMSLCFEIKDYQKALFYAKKILELDEEDIIALRIAKLSAQKLEKWPDALKYAEEYLNFWPDHPAALGIASLAAMKMGNYEKALEYAAQKIELEKNDRKLMPTLGIAARTAYNLNRNEEALKYCKRYLEFSPRNEEKLKIAAFSAFHLKKYEEAIHYARRYYNDKSLPYDPDITYVLAACAYELGLLPARQRRY